METMEQLQCFGFGCVDLWTPQPLENSQWTLHLCCGSAQCTRFVGVDRWCFSWVPLARSETCFRTETAISSALASGTPSLAPHPPLRLDINMGLVEASSDETLFQPCTWTDVGHWSTSPCVVLMDHSGTSWGAGTLVCTKSSTMMCKWNKSLMDHKSPVSGVIILNGSSRYHDSLGLKSLDPTHQQFIRDDGTYIFPSARFRRVSNKNGWLRGSQKDLTEQWRSL